MAIGQCQLTIPKKGIVWYGSSHPHQKLSGLWDMNSQSTGARDPKLFLSVGLQTIHGQSEVWSNTSYISRYVYTLREWGSQNNLHPDVDQQGFKQYCRNFQKSTIDENRPKLCPWVFPVFSSKTSFDHPCSGKNTTLKAVQIIWNDLRTFRGSPVRS